MINMSFKLPNFPTLTSWYRKLKCHILLCLLKMFHETNYVLSLMPQNPDNNDQLLHYAVATLEIMKQRDSWHGCWYVNIIESCGLLSQCLVIAETEKP